MGKELNNKMLNPYRQRSITRTKNRFVPKATQFQIAACQAFQSNEKGSEFYFSLDGEHAMQNYKTKGQNFFSYSVMKNARIWKTSFLKK